MNEGVEDIFQQLIAAHGEETVRRAHHNWRMAEIREDPSLSIDVLDNDWWNGCVGYETMPLNGIMEEHDADSARSLTDYIEEE